MTIRHPRVYPWLRAALALYLAGAALLVAFHQHRDARETHDCALCTVANTATTLPAVPAPVAPPAVPARILPAPAFQEYDAPLSFEHSSRAPPQV